MQDGLDILRTQDEQQHGLAHRYIFGLNLFDYNGVDCPIGQRPDVVLLRRLTERVPCAAQVGALYLKDRVDSPDEMFGPPHGPDAATPYSSTRVGYSDDFYELGVGIDFDVRLLDGGSDGEVVYGGRYFGDCLFPEVTPAFWQALLRGGGDDLDHLIGNHALVLYAGPKAGDADERLARLLLEPFPGKGPLLQAVTALYSVALLVGHDGQYLHAWAREAADFTLLEPALSDAVRAVEESEWFQANRGELAWSEDLDACLMLPRRAHG